MRWWLYVMWVSVVLGGGAARAEERSITDRTWVLRGRTPSFATAFSTGPGPVTVSLRVAASDVLDRDDSRLTVAIDGVPLRTSSLGRITDADGEGGLEVRTDPLAAGTHLLEITARLRVDDDPCLTRTYQDAWLRIEAESTLETVDVFDAPSDDVPTRARRLLSAAGGAAFVEAEVDDATAAALVELGAAVARRGGRLVGRERRPDVVLRVVDAPTRDRHHRRLDPLLAHHGTDALWVVDHDELVVVAADTQALRRAVTALVDPTFLELCGVVTVCPVGGVRVSEKTPPAEVAQSLTVRTLADLGHRDGLVVRGLGDHAVRFVENDPHRWSLVAPPVVRLPYQLPSGAGDRSYDVRVTVELNDQPIDTWRLDAGTRARGEIRAELPLALARAAGAWVIDVEIHTRLREGQTCTDDEDDTTTWLRVPPDAGLDVARDETAPTGIAAFAQTAATSGATLVLDPTMRDPARLLAAAGLLARLLPVPVRIGDTGHGPSIRLADVTTMPGVTVVTAPDGERLRITADGEALPLVPSRTTMLLACASGSECPTLTVGLPADVGTMTAPDFSQLGAPLAIGTEGRLRPLGPVAGTVVAHRVEAPRDAEPPSAVGSVRENRLVVVDAIWAGIVVALGLLGTLVHRRARSDVRIASRDVETLSTSEGGRA